MPDRQQPRKLKLGLGLGLGVTLSRIILIKIRMAERQRVELTDKRPIYLGQTLIVSHSNTVVITGGDAKVRRIKSDTNPYCH